MLNKILIFIFILICSLQLNAGMLPAMLIEDLQHEILEADFISLDKDKRAHLISKINQAFNTNADEVYRIIQSELANELPHFKKNYESIQVIGTRNNDYTTIQPIEKLKIDGAHAIHDLRSYSQNRMGHGTTRFLKETKGEIVVIAAHTNEPVQTIAQVLKPTQWTIMPIPSLYEHWGIQKFYVHSAKDSNSEKIVWIIPPSIQYLQHYVNTFGLYSKTKVKGYFDHQSADQFRRKISNEVKLAQVANSKIDYLIFGYQKVWENYLNHDLKDSIIEQSKIEIPAAHSNINIFKIKSEKSPSGHITLGLFSTNSTLWGELINTYIPSFFHRKLKGVIFMGSAGSLDPDIKIYDLSVPISFVRSGKRMKLSNLLYSDNVQGAEISERHGHTFSPVQQNKSYLNTLVSKNIETIDVEQSLLAEMVEEFNRTQNTKIQYGAINLITDKPLNALTGKSDGLGLDQYDPKKKQKAREQAVQFVMKSLLDITTEVQSCKSIISQ